MSTMSNRLLVSSVFWECDPLPTTSLTLGPGGGGGGGDGQSPGIGGQPTVYTTVYTTTLVNACPTSEWIETYTVTETCTGDKAHYTRPPVPPHFTTTVVVCHVCSHKTQTIYQPAGPAPTSGPGHDGGSNPSQNPPGPGLPAPVPAPASAPAPGHDDGGNPPAASPVPGSQPSGSDLQPDHAPGSGLPNPSSPSPPSQKPNEPAATPTSPENPAATATAGAASVKRGVIALTGLAMVLIPLVM